MKSLLLFLFNALAMVGYSQVDAFVHTTHSSNIRDNYSYLDHPQLNGNPNAIFQMTPLVSNNHRHTGVWYDSNKRMWAVYNQDRSPMPSDVAFNIVIPNNGFVQRAPASTGNNYFYINNPACDGNPGALVFITPVYNPNGSGDTYNNHATGVWYDSGRQKWAIFNQDRAAMPFGAAFFVHVIGAPSARTFTMGRAGFEGLLPPDFSALGDVVVVTQNWNPGGVGGVYNDAIVQVGLDPDSRRLLITNRNSQLVAGSSYNVYKYNPVSSFDYEREIPPNNIYRISNVQNGKVVEVEDGVSSGGVWVNQYRGYARNGLCDGKNQEWLFIPAGQRNGLKVFYIINNGFLKYLEGSAIVAVGDGNDTERQLWYIIPIAGDQRKYYLRSVATNKYLQVPNGNFNDGAACQTANFTGATNQQFQFTRYVGLLGPQNYNPGSFVRIASAMHPGQCLNITDASTANGAIIQSYNTSPGAQNEHWQFVRTPDGYYKIQSRLGISKVADINTYHGGNNSRLLIWDNAEVEKQKWLIVPVVREPGRYIFFNKVSGRCLDLAGASNANHTPIQTFLFANGLNQKWLLNPAN